MVRAASLWRCLSCTVDRRASAMIGCTIPMGSRHPRSKSVRPPSAPRGERPALEREHVEDAVAEGQLARFERLVELHRPLERLDAVRPDHRADPILVPDALAVLGPEIPFEIVVDEAHAAVLVAPQAIARVPHPQVAADRLEVRPCSRPHDLGGGPVRLGNAGRDRRRVVVAVPHRLGGRRRRRRRRWRRRRVRVCRGRVAVAAERRQLSLRLELVVVLLLHIARRLRRLVLTHVFRGLVRVEGALRIHPVVHKLPLRKNRAVPRSFIT
mmetsp:Transcript_24340/g.78480  ORF Transcript_24340/g.78480 Transcript_24340/m.78480 type:complete len:269 (-) Transcript_24340:12-818(-)